MTDLRDALHGPATGGPGALPDQRTLLTWLFGGRAALAVVALLAAAVVWTDRPSEAFLAAVLVVLALVITTYSAWRVVIRGAEGGPTFRYVQALTDLALVAAIVHLAGPRSVFAALYIPVVAVHALLLPLRGGIVVLALATTVFLGDAILGQPEPADRVVGAQSLVFLAVFAVVTLLGARLRSAGMEQVTLATELRRAQLEAGDILGSIRAGVLSVDGDGRLAFLNPTGERLLELGGDAMRGRPILAPLRARSPELADAVEQGLRGGPRLRRGEGWVRLNDGRRIPIGLSTAVFTREQREPPSVTAIFSDISDLKRLQELQLRTERLEAVAALSAGLAHEIRNPLASIRSAVEQLARRAQSGDDERVLAALIVRESDRLSRLLGEFLDFSRVRAARVEPILLREVAEAAVALVRQHPDIGPEAVILVTGDDVTIEGDADLLHRTVANLVLNAVQAAGEHPVRVRVSVAALGADEGPAGLDGPLVRLEVRDDGPGIPDDIRDRLFEPFVSARVGGSGLGLAIVQRAVAAHRGVVLVDSAADAGTTFTIYLPTRAGDHHGGGA